MYDTDTSGDPLTLANKDGPKPSTGLNPEAVISPNDPSVSIITLRVRTISWHRAVRVGTRSPKRFTDPPKKQPNHEINGMRAIYDLVRAKGTGEEGLRPVLNAVVRPATTCGLALNVARFRVGLWVRSWLRRGLSLSCWSENYCLSKLQRNL